VCAWAAFQAGQATQGIDCLQRQKKTKKAAVAGCLRFLLKPDGKVG
jgi:hypothetical protein